LNEWEKWCRKRDKFYESVRSEESYERTERMKRELDVGTSLCELFGDSYSRYQQRREEKIAKQRRKLAQINSSIQGLKEQSEKSESNVAEYTNKIAMATKENIALENYLRKAHEALVVLTKSMVNIPNFKLTNSGDEGQNTNTMTCSLTINSNKAAVGSLLNTVDSTKEIEWTQQTRDYARRICVNQLDTGCVQNLGMKAIQKILMQMAKEQKSRKTSRRGKRRSTISNSSNTTITKRNKNIIGNGEILSNNGGASKRKRAPRRTQQKLLQNAQVSTRDNLESKNKPAARRGRRPKSKKVDAENHAGIGEAPKSNEGAADMIGDCSKRDDSSNSNFASLDNSVENGINQTGGIGSTSTNKNINIDSVNGDITMNANVVNNGVIESIKSDRELNDRKEEPSNTTTNMGFLEIAKLLNPVENTISTLKSRINGSSGDSLASTLLANNLYTLNNNLTENSNTGSTSINISALHNNFINHSMSSHLSGVTGNEGISSNIYSNSDLGISTPYLFS
ncbi:10372_t:CDS:1, partial [Acaulospora morrowiae]